MKLSTDNKDWAGIPNCHHLQHKESKMARPDSTRTIQAKAYTMLLRKARKTKQLTGRGI